MNTSFFGPCVPSRCGLIFRQCPRNDRSEKSSSVGATCSEITMGILPLLTVPRDLVTLGLGVRLSSIVINNRSGQVRVNISTGLSIGSVLSNNHSVIPSLVGDLKDVTLYLGAYVVEVLWKVMFLLGFYLLLYLVCL